MRKHRNPSFVFILTSLALLITLAGGSWSTAYGAGLAQGTLPMPASFITPTFQIMAVQPDQSVTIKTANFPANDTFDVLMNTFGTRGVGGVKVDTIQSGGGGTFTFTFNTPASLKGQRLIAIRLESAQSGYFSYNWFYNTSTGANPGTGGIPETGGLPTGTIPTISVASVDPDKTVTITTSNYPANTAFNVLMNTIGTRGVGGYQVATINSGSGGSFNQTFNIPNELKGLRQIAIRLESPSTGYFSYNWFYNTTGGANPGTGGIPETGGPGLPPGVIPTFTITAVTPDDSVSIKTANFPANDTFDVTMGLIGTRGVGGVKVDTISSSTGGTFTYTFKVPASLKGQRQIAIRLQSPNTGYFAYNWFYNNSTAQPGTGGIPETGGPGTLPPGVIPTITVTAVNRDNTVTVQTSNYPTNDTFTVTMGAFGTKGVGGVNVGTWNSGAGGTQTATFNIPASLKGSNQIAIRLQSDKTGYFSYNWFNNQTYP